MDVLLTLFCLFTVLSMPYVLVGVLIARVALRHRMEELISVCTDPSHWFGVHTPICGRVVVRGSVSPRTSADINYAFWAGLFWPIWLIKYATRQAIKSAPKTRAEVDAENERLMTEMEMQQARLNIFEKRMLK